MRRCLWLLLVALLLASCSQPMPRPEGADYLAQEQREQRLLRYSTWSASGRIAVDDGRDGGSGQFRWKKDPEGFELLVRAPLGQGSWRLFQREGEDAVLEASQLPEPVSGPDPESLVADQIGWRVPIGQMTWWARAMRAPDGVAELQLNPQQLPGELSQQGWQVSYTDYIAVGDLTMPRKLQAEHDRFSVRVVVATWRLEPDLDAQN